MVDHVMLAAEEAPPTGAGDADAAAEDPTAIEHAKGEVVVHAMLRLVCEHPGMLGRLRAARVVGGFKVPEREGGPSAGDLARYTVQVGLHLKDVVSLVDAMLEGGLLAQTPGLRPTLVLTRGGFRALEALERA